MKILSVEDSAPSALFLQRTLERLGHEIRVVPNGEEKPLKRARAGSAPQLNVNGAGRVGVAGTVAGEGAEEAGCSCGGAPRP